MKLKRRVINTSVSHGEFVEELKQPEIKETDESLGIGYNNILNMGAPAKGDVSPNASKSDYSNAFIKSKVDDISAS